MTIKERVMLCVLWLGVISTGYCFVLIGSGCTHNNVAVTATYDGGNGTGIVTATIPEGSVTVSLDAQAIIDAVLGNGDSIETKGVGDRAVVFGDNFPGTSAELNECVNDAYKNVVNLVKFDKFDVKNIRLFLNQKCTKINYEKWSTWAVADSKPGDRRVIMNSSHGAQDTDNNGNVTDIIVTWDMIAKNRWDETTEVSADFWKETLRNTQHNFLVLNDSCYAGGAMRAAMSAQAIKVRKKVRALDGPAVVQARIDTAVKHVTLRTSLSALTGTVIPACQASETSEESSDFGGAATEAFWRARKSLPVTATTADIVREANRVLRTNGFSQHMGLVGQVKVLFAP